MAHAWPQRVAPTQWFKNRDGMKLRVWGDAREWLVSLDCLGKVPVMLVQYIEVVLGSSVGPFEAECWGVMEWETPMPRC